MPRPVRRNVPSGDVTTTCWHGRHVVPSPRSVGS
jgi:hypothetical protein